MTREKLRKIQRQIDALRRTAVTHSDVASVANQLGRKRLKGAMARKEPTFISTVFASARPISIPDHGSRNLSPIVKKNVLNDLEEDILRFQEMLRKEEENDVQENGGYSN
jgi:predicted nucleic acid-binding OB-fold protein